MCESEKQAPVDQRHHPAVFLLAARPDFFAQQGSVDASWRRRGDKTFGPYYRLRYREGRSSRSLYLGPAGPLVDYIRHTLHILQAPLRQQRALEQLRRQVRDALRLDRHCVDVRLRSLGLRLKGFEVRGWRTSPLHAFTRPTSAGAVPVFAPPKTGQSLLRSAQLKPIRLPRVRRLRFVPKGLAAKWFRANRPKVPQLPTDRLAAFLDARDRIACKPRR